MFKKDDIALLLQENPLMALQRIMQILRHPQEGCAWDKQQTHKSIASSLIEETYEVYQALLDYDVQNAEAINNLKEELGDLLLQIVFHAQMAKEQDVFDIDDVAREICNKLIRRHPHIFKEKHDKTTSKAQVLKNWEQIKREENTQKKSQKENIFQSMLASLPTHLPSLQKAQRIGQKTRRVNFHLPSESIQESFVMLQTKWNELETTFQNLNLENSLELSQSSLNQAEKKLGDFLFCLSQFSQLYHLDAEKALYNANKEFQLHFSFVEENFQEQLLQNELPTQLEWQEQWKKMRNKF